MKYLIYPIELHEGDRVTHNGKDRIIKKIYKFTEKLYRLEDDTITTSNKLEKRSYEK